MNKLLSIILALVLTLLLSACGGAEVPQASSPGENSGLVSSETEISLTGEIGGEITVSAYNTMMSKAFLEDAASLFEEKYPGTTVNIETFSAMPDIRTGGGMVMADLKNDPQGRQDYINKVNTALMSGVGADILAMDVLPSYKYADIGQLENLAVYMQADTGFNKADYRTNIFDAVEYKNGTWFLPLDYTFNFYAYDSALLTENTASGFGTGGKYTAEELIALAKPSFDGTSKIFNRPDYASGPRPDMWSLLLEENYASFVDIENKAASFDDGSFENLLEAIKGYSEQGYISKGAAGQGDAGVRMKMPEDGVSDRFFFKSKDDFSLIAFFTRNLGMKMSAMGEGDTMIVGDDDEIAGIAACADGSVPFTYSQAYGLNSNSKNKETAWTFLKFLLGEEIQLSTRLSQPVLNSAREIKMEVVMASFSEAQENQAQNPALQGAIVEYSKAAEKLSGQINAYFIRDTVIDDMIAAEVQYFFEGTKTAAEVADMLQNKVTLYMNE